MKSLPKTIALSIISLYLTTGVQANDDMDIDLLDKQVKTIQQKQKQIESAQEVQNAYEVSAQAAKDDSKKVKDAYKEQVDAVKEDAKVAQHTYEEQAKAAKDDAYNAKNATQALESDLKDSEKELIQNVQKDLSFFKRNADQGMNINLLDQQTKTVQEKQKQVEHAREVEHAYEANAQAAKDDAKKVKDAYKEQVNSVKEDAKVARHTYKEQAKAAKNEAYNAKKVKQASESDLEKLKKELIQNVEKDLGFFKRNKVTLAALGTFFTTTIFHSMTPKVVNFVRTKLLSYFIKGISAYAGRIIKPTE